MKNIAIITGASSGMGRDFCRLIDRRIKNIDELWILSRRAERLEELEKECKKKCKIFAGNICDVNLQHELESQLSKEKVQVRMLVNAAGFGKIGPFTDVDYRQNIGMVATNCMALTAITQMVLPHMAAHGIIVNFASVAAFLPQPEFSVYAATKSYVLSFSRALNVECKKRDISVTAVCPGPVKTEFFDIAEETGATPWYKKYFYVDSKKVVHKAFEDAISRKEISVYSLPMKLFLVLSKILPHHLLLKFF